MRTLRLGDRLILDLVEWLEEQAFEPEAQVTARGELSLRGGIVDVFPFTTVVGALRIFGDELESLRYFNPHSQMSREKLMRSRYRPAVRWGCLSAARQSTRHLA